MVIFQLLFNIDTLNSDVYIVILVEKVLQGGVSSSVDPYLKGNDPKTAAKVHKTMKQFCNSLGHYRMPFAWAAK